MKYISVEELKREISKSPVWTGLDMIARIKVMPTIDIVRCKECKHWSYSDLIESHNRCERTMKLTKPDDYCSYGEREGE